MGLRLHRTLSHLGRLRHVAGVLGRHGFHEALATMGRKRRLRRGSASRGGKPHLTRPERVRLALEEMGPTFVKFGQLLSTRPDIVPPVYIQELEKLQDRVRHIPFDKIKRELGKQLNGPIRDHFREIDPDPIAAGSIAQVHRATTVEGHDAAVKIRRPGIARTVRVECEILEEMAGLVKTVFAMRENVDPVRLVGDLTRAINRETDLCNELRNLRGFQRNFEGDETVHVPTPYPEHCSAGVLTMEYIDGLKPTSREVLVQAGYDPDVIAHRGARFVLRQVFDFGTFHTDPHPGNMLVLDGNVVAPLDFGQVARLCRRNQMLLAEAVLAVVEQDPDRLVRAFQQQGMVGSQTDPRALSDDLEELLDIYHNLPLAEIPFGRMVSQTFELIRQHEVQPPSEFALMLKSTMTVESLAQGLSSNFRLIDELRPYARRLALRQMDPRQLLKTAKQAADDSIRLAGRLPGDITAIIEKVRRGEFQLHIEHEHLDDLVRTMHRSSNRLSFALIIAGLLMASSFLAPQEGSLLGLVSLQTLGVLGYCAAAVLGLWLVGSIIRSRHV